jgi:Protein of unknown function (DUF3037)
VVQGIDNSRLKRFRESDVTGHPDEACRVGIVRLVCDPLRVDDREDWRGALDGTQRAEPTELLIAPLRHSESGAAAFLGLVESGFQYWIKVLGNPQGDQILVTEQLVSAAGRLINAPVRPTALVQIPAELSGWQYAEVHRLAEGVAHGSLNLESADVIDELLYTASDDNAQRQPALAALWRGTEVASMRYNYWLLRYAPDSARGEFVNVGVVVGSDDSDDWAFGRIHSLARASRLGGDASRIEDWLIRLHASISPEWPLERAAALGVRLRLSLGSFDRIRRQLNNTFQISSPRPVLATSADAAADQLFAQLVAVAESRTKSSERAAAVRDLREAYYRTGNLAPKDVQHNVRLHVGRQQTRFEFAIGRSRIAQLSHVWSFRRSTVADLAQEIQAASYAIKRLREHGGYLENPNRSKQPDLLLPPGVPVRVLYVPPESSQQRDVFGNAEDAWPDLGIRPYPLGEEDLVAEEAVALLRAS